MEEKLFAEKEALRKKAEKFGEVNAAVDVLDQQKKENASLVLEMDKLKVQLEMLNTVTGEISWSDVWEGSTKFTGTMNGF